MMIEKPDFTPVHKTPVWLSQFDVEQAIKRVVESRGNAAKAIGWDMLVAISRLADARTPTPETQHD